MARDADVAWKGAAGIQSLGSMRAGRFALNRCWSTHRRKNSRVATFCLRNERGGRRAKAEILKTRLQLARLHARPIRSRRLWADVFTAETLWEN